jgi:hypothetical protein
MSPIKNDLLSSKTIIQQLMTAKVLKTGLFNKKKYPGGGSGIQQNQQRNTNNKFDMLGFMTENQHPG